LTWIKDHQQQHKIAPASQPASQMDGRPPRPNAPVRRRPAVPRRTPSKLCPALSPARSLQDDPFSLARLAKGASRVSIFFNGNLTPAAATLRGGGGRVGRGRLRRDSQFVAGG
jgi:hypothetical protein